jgi:hypothetical protein
MLPSDFFRRNVVKSQPLCGSTSSACPSYESADLRIVASHQLRDTGTQIGAVYGCTCCSRGVTSSKSITPFQ